MNVNTSKIDRKNGVINTNLRLLGKSEVAVNIRSFIAQVGATNASVLLIGERGVGKGTVARLVHEFSQRADGPFVYFNCGFLTGEYLDAELHGCGQGDETGSIKQLEGAFDSAKGGTLFLHHIDRLSSHVQAKLTHFLQKATYRSAGGTEENTEDARIIASTSENLEQRVDQNAFRRDLYLHLSEFRLEIPALRERSADIYELAEHFIEEFSNQGYGTFHFENEVLALLKRYPWPGNLRELRNLIERLCILKTGQAVFAVDLPLEFQSGVVEQEAPLNIGSSSYSHFRILPLSVSGTASTLTHIAEPINLKQHLAEIERSLIISALEHSSWVIAHAAKLLTLRRTTLIEKMRRYDITRNAHEFDL